MPWIEEVEQYKLSTVDVSQTEIYSGFPHYKTFMRKLSSTLHLTLHETPYNFTASFRCRQTMAKGPDENLSTQDRNGISDEAFTPLEVTLSLSTLTDDLRLCAPEWYTRPPEQRQSEQRRPYQRQSKQIVPRVRKDERQNARLPRRSRGIERSIGLGLFGRLPFEIRQEIFTYLLQFKTKRWIHSKRKLPEDLI